MTATPRKLVTRQRIAILRTLEDAEAFLTASELHSAMSEAGVTAGLATVYRCLEELVAAEKVDVLRHEGESARYRMCPENKHHHHLRCRICHSSVDLVDPDLEAWAQKVARRNRFSNVSHSIELVGECRDCRSDER